MNSQHTILIVEDDRDIRENLQDVLENEGYTVVAAANGVAALELLRAQASSARPSLIILDFMMPRMDGRSFLKTIQEYGWNDLEQIPVILVTASREKWIDDFPQVRQVLRKPLELDELTESIKAYSLVSA